MAKLKLEINLPVLFLREGKKFIAYTPSLDLSTYGKNYDEAKKRFNEVVKIFFEEIIKKGTIDKVLSELGWQKIQSRWTPPAVVSQEYQSVHA